MSDYSEISGPINVDDIDTAERIAVKAGLGFHVRVKRVLFGVNARVTFTNSEPNNRVKVAAMRAIAEMYGI